MCIRSKIFHSALLTSTLAFASCSKGTFSSPLYLAVAITPRAVSVPVGGSVLLTAAVSNNLSLPTWSILDASDTPAAGTLSAVSGSANSILYTAPATPPIYSSAVQVGFAQGTITVQAAAAPPPLSTLPVAHDSVTFFITSPTITVGISPAAANVPLGTQLYFAGYAAGSVNNALIWQVNGVSGGSTTTGTISSAGIYTAPATLPMAGNTVTITVISQADPTKTASAVVTL